MWVGEWAVSAHGMQAQTFRMEGWASDPLNTHLKSCFSNKSAEASAKRTQPPFLVFRRRRKEETGQR